VSEADVKVGDTVEKGQELVRFQTDAAADALKDNQSRYEQKEWSLKKLKDNYNEALRGGNELQIRGLYNDIQSLRLDMDIAKRQMDSQKRQIEQYAKLKAPISGIVTEVNAVKGAPVQGGKAAVRIADLSKGQQMKAQVDENKVQYVNVGDEIEIVFATLSNARVKAKVTDIRDAVSSSASGGSAQPGQNLKEITFTFQDERLKGGETGDFNISKRTTPMRALLPNDAIREDDNGTYVLILKEKKGSLGTEYMLQKATVQTGDSDDEKTSIENGVSPMDKVVVSSNKPVADKDRVLMTNK
jgi:HlyD family secretion protein